MAVTQNSYNGNGSTTNYAFTFPYLKSSEVKAQIDATVTTAFTLANATTVQFNTAPANGAKIKIYRETDTDSLAATFYAGSAIKSEDLNDNFTQNLHTTQEVNARYLSNLGGTMVGDMTMAEDVDIIFEGATDDAYETTLTVADPTADRVITLPNITGTVVTTGDTGTVTATMLAANSVDSSELVDGSVDTSHIADSQITTAKIANNAITAAKIASDTITDAEIATDAVTATELANNAVDTAAIANDAVTQAKIANDAVGADQLASNSVVSASIVDGTIVTADIADNAITNAKLADDTVGADELIDSSVNTAALASNAVTLAKMADNSVGTAELVNDGVTTVKLANNAVTTAKITDSNITTAKINNNAVTAAKIAADTITDAEIATDAITATELADNAVDTAAIANNAVTSAKIAANAVTTTEIADAELTTLAGMQSGTASILAGGTALTATLAEINTVVDGKSVETTISDTDAAYPTSGAVVDYVAAQIAPLGGLEVIANEDSFPTQPASGVVISIADAGGIVVNGSGVSTTARTSGNGSDNVTINGFPSSLYSTTLAANMGLMVSSTGSSNTYTYHKLLGKEDDIKQLSDDINDFQARYRVASSAPSSSLDNGDLWYDTSNAKMMVYNSTASAWEEVTSTGDFYINTISSYSGTGGNSATFNGSAYRFVLSNPPQAAQQLIVSVNGVLQKPNSGTGQPSEGFALNGSSIVFSAAPATSSPYFIITVGSTVAIGTPSDNTVATAKIQNLAVTTAKIAADAIDGTKIADDAVGAEHIEVLDANLQLADSVKIQVGTGNDLELYHDGDSSYINHVTSGTDLVIDAKSPGDDLILRAADDVEIRVQGNENAIKCIGDGAVELYHDGSKKFNTTSAGAQLTGSLAFMSESTNISILDNGKAKFGNGDDLQIYHNGSDSYIDDQGTGQLRLCSNELVGLNAAHSEYTFKAFEDGAVELYYNGTKTLYTDTYGAIVVAPEGGAAELQIWGDEGDDNNDKYMLDVYDGRLRIKNYTSGSWETNIECNGDGNVELYYDGTLKCSTYGDGLNFPDVAIASFGANNDMKLYHYNDTNFIVSGNGHITTRVPTTKGFRVQKDDGQEDVLNAYADGAVELYYDGSKKLETASHGITALGDVFFDNQVNAGKDVYWDESADRMSWSDNVHATFGNGEDLRIYHDGTYNKITLGGKELQILGGGSNNKKIFVADTNNAALLYHDDVKKFETDTDGVQVTGILQAHENISDSAYTSHSWHVLQADNSGSSALVVENSGDSQPYGIYLIFSDTDPDDNTRTFINMVGGTTERCKIYSDGDIWNHDDSFTGSDQTLKENIVDATPKLEDLKKLKVRNFNWKSEYFPEKSKKKQLGFIAQEVEQVFPALVSEHDIVGSPDQDGHTPVMKKAIKQAWAPILVKALQEAVEKIETLETKVAALEAK